MKSVFENKFKCKTGQELYNTLFLKNIFYNYKEEGRMNGKCPLSLDLRFMNFVFYNFCPYLVITQEVKKNGASFSRNVRKQFSGNRHLIQSVPLSLFRLLTVLFPLLPSFSHPPPSLNGGGLCGSNQIPFTSVSVVPSVMPGSQVLHKCFSQYVEARINYS